MTHPYESIETFVAEKMPDVTWHSSRQDLIYLGVTKRLVLTVEAAGDGKYFGYDLYRHDILAEAGIYDANIDSDHLGQEVWDKLFRYTSVRDMVAIRTHIDKYVNDWNDRRMASGHPSYFEEAEYEAIGQNGTSAEGKV